MKHINIRETGEKDLVHLLDLWNNGDVMYFVGFPDGLGETMEGMHKWYEWIVGRRPLCNHYSIYDNEDYCGETFYAIDIEHGYATSLDIKLFASARGKGIATQALSYAIEQAFANGAKLVWVDPNPKNHKAIALYERLGFVRKDMPAYLLNGEEEENNSVYMEKRMK